MFIYFSSISFDLQTIGNEKLETKSICSYFIFSKFGFEFINCIKVLKFFSLSLTISFK